MARVAAQYAYMVSSDFESPEARYALGPYTPVDPTTVVYRAAVTRSLYAIEVVLLFYVAYITERLTLLPLRDNISESWENDVFIVIWTHFRLHITHLSSNSSVLHIE